MDDASYRTFLDKFKDRACTIKLPTLSLYKDVHKGISIFTTTDIQMGEAVCWYTGCVVLADFVEAEVIRHNKDYTLYSHLLAIPKLPLIYGVENMYDNQYSLDARNFAVLLKNDTSFIQEHIWACGGMLNAPAFYAATDSPGVICPAEDANVECYTDRHFYKLYNATYEMHHEQTSGLFGYGGILMCARIPIRAMTELTFRYDCTENYDPAKVEAFKFDFNMNK